MKNKLFLSIFLCCLLSGITFAAGVDYDGAMAMYRQGKFAQAHEALAAVVKTQPEAAGVARYYDALCLYELKNYRKCRARIEAVRKSAVALTPAQTEDLDFKYVAAGFGHREFATVRGEIAKFQAKYPGSEHARAARELAMLSNFEAGDKNIYDAQNLIDPATPKDRKDLQTRLADGRARLAEFQTAFAAMTGDDLGALQFIDLEKLQENVWRARILTEDDATVKDLMTAMSPDDREKFAFLRVNMHGKYRQAEKENNLLLSLEFANEYPHSEHAGQTRVIASHLLFELTENDLKSYFKMAKYGVRDLGEPSTATLERVDLFRGLCDDVFNDHSLPAGDRTDLAQDYVASFLATCDYGRAIDEARRFLPRYAVGTRDWAVFKMYESIALGFRDASGYGAAMKGLDWVVASPLADDKHKEQPLRWVAAEWQVGLALRRNEIDDARAVLDMIRRELPDGSLKQSFAEKYGSLWGDNNSLMTMKAAY